MCRRSPLLALLLSVVGLVSLLAPAPARATTPRDALLTTADLPPGWEVLNEAGPAPSSYAWCPGGATLPVTPIAGAVRSFAGGAPGPLVYHEVLRFAPGGAATAMAAVRAHPGACSWSDAEAELAPMTFELGAMEELAWGAGAVQRRLIARWEGMVAMADIVIVRAGDALALLTHLAVGPADTVVDSALTEQLARRAADKLATVAVGESYQTL
jgi:hypothetical protein